MQIPHDGVQIPHDGSYGAFMNMKINASSLKDKAFVDDIIGKGQELIDKADAIEKEYTARILKQISE